MLSVAVFLTVSLDHVSALTFGGHQHEPATGLNANHTTASAANSHLDAPIDLNGGTQFGRVTHAHTSNINAHRVDNEKRQKETKPLPSWDYAKHGADWTHGMCKIGRAQSPVDLHAEGLQTPRPDNIKDVLEAVLKGNSVPHSITNDWKRGDIVYTYRHFISSVQVLRTDKVFRLSVPSNEGSVFGALFTTDKPNLYMATHIEFHSPSEHTFDGSANRRQIEVQIWHYYGDDMDAGISAIEKNETTDLNVIVNSQDTEAPPAEDAVDKAQDKTTDAVSADNADTSTSTTTSSSEADASGTSDAVVESPHESNDKKSDVATTTSTKPKSDASHSNVEQHPKSTDAAEHPPTTVNHSAEQSSKKSMTKSEQESDDDDQHDDDEDGTKESDEDDEQSFIEILSDVQMADGTHKISPKSAAKDPLPKDDKDKDATGQGKPEKNEGAPNGHPLKTDKSSVYTDMVENEQFELLNKYLLDHLHNATYDQAGERMHISEKRKARNNNTHWGRWAVLSMTFMSEEMQRTKIETLKSFPSERFMEQVLKLGSEVELSADDMYSSVGELNSGGGADLPVVELDTPINLSSLLMMIETKDLNYFAYDGSFTRPGCEETVRWYVAKEPLPVSTEVMLRIHRMLNQTRDQSATSEPINKYRELQNVNDNRHNSGKVHLVHGYPIEYFIAASFDRPREPCPKTSSGTAMSLVAVYVALAIVTLLQM